MSKKNIKIILASTSPRRQELFSKLRLPFIIEAPDYEEDMTLKMNPMKLAKVLSRGKAASVAAHHKEGIVIGADTFVVLGNKLMGKPKNKLEARKMLSLISGKRVDVLTGLTIIDIKKHKTISIVDMTKVYIRKISASEITNYIISGETIGKAGAFTAQGLGAALIKRIEGDFMGVLGLPLFALARELKKTGVKVL